MLYEVITRAEIASAHKKYIEKRFCDPESKYYIPEGGEYRKRAILIMEEVMYLFDKILDSLEESLGEKCKQFS